MDPVTLNALTRRWQLDELGLDQEANTARINYRRTKGDLRRTNKKTAESQAANLADRGLARSGIAVKTGMDRQQDYNRAFSIAGQNKELALSNIVRQRVLAKSAYDQARAAAMLGTATVPTTPTAQDFKWPQQQ